MNLDAISELCNLLEPLSYLVDDTRSTNTSKSKSVNGMPNDSLAKSLARQCNGEILTEAKHPDLLKAVNRMASDLKLGYNPTVVCGKTLPFGLAAIAHAPNAAGLPEDGIIILNHGLLNLTKDHLSSKPSTKLQSIIAHELAHLKHDAGGQLAALHFSGYLLPIAAMAGLYIFDKARAKKPDANFTEMHQQIQQTADEEHQQLNASMNKKATVQIESRVHHPLIQMGRYTAAAMVGLGASMLLKRNLSLNREFRADRIAVELVRDAEAYKEGLSGITHSIHKALQGLAEEFVEKKTIGGKTITAGDWLQMIRNEIEMHTTHAHPTLKQRHSYIDQVVAEQAKKAAGAAAAIH